MKKLLAILLAMVLGLSLCACPASEVNSSETKEVHITAGKIEPGMTAKDILVEVTIDSQPVSCLLELIGFDWEGNWIMSDDEVIPENFYVRLGVYYTLPKGYELENIHVTITCDGGQYDDTYIVCSNAESSLDVVSYAFYGEEPQPPADIPLETQPTETQPHVHEWVEKTDGFVYVSCTTDSKKTYTCSCGETKEETVPASGHDLREWSVSPATCTRGGTESTSCKRCGQGFLQDLPATGHDWSAWIKETGSKHKRTCNTCGAEEEADHNIPSGSVTCTDCGEDIIN